TGLDLPNDLLAKLAQIDGISAVKQANPDNLALIDGLELYAGNDDMLCDVLELGGAGGICVASHIVGEQMHRIADEPGRARELDAQLADLYEALSVTTNPIPIKAALNLLGHQVGGLRLPLVEADDDERATIAAALERHGLSVASTAARG
ncbi:MAG TPA: dihydrodipicolinate synthase family protein, partial [Solirubrobacteraceae bacterium]|nr:dihydrodipicolinate synthase family protein [Solirubrobacteraceae bacterium]